MAGIYLHIPFCRLRCAYCAFHSGTDLEPMAHYVDALCRELEMRRHYLQEPVETIYFGGGTPSLLSGVNLQRILTVIDRNYAVRGGAEITIECNPDDLDEARVAELKALNFNRISLGVQSFDDQILRMLGRRHNSAQVVRAVRVLQNAGFQNISIDLMFALPNQTMAQWRQTLAQAVDLGVQHISAYNLSVEAGTPLERLLQRGTLAEASDELSLQMFEELRKVLIDNGFEHYEISNFALPQFASRHNSAYWHGAPYLGVGAAAHSYDGAYTRQWNVANTVEYVSSVERGVVPCECEHLTPDEQYNELVFTALRTRDGVSLKEIEHRFGIEKKEFCLAAAQRFLQAKTLIFENNSLKLTPEGIFVSDGIIAALMSV